MTELSVVIATYNEEQNIERCLKSVSSIAGEIIIVDANSTDNTREIVKKYKAKIYLFNNAKIFHKNKQYGLEKASGDWILQLDADEVVTPELLIEIKKRINQEEYDAYYIPRRNFFLGKFMEKGGLYPDGVIRLFKNGKGRFPCKSVHEQIVIIGKVGWIINSLLHYSYPTISSYLIKANRYTKLTAEDLFKQKVKINFINFIKYYFVLPIKSFANIFIRHQGYYDGFRGFVWAILSSTHYLFAYAKLMDLYRGNYENSN